MKKILPLRCHIAGFSLAEALITLLIVCLITLASIPVLTKKRRDMSQMKSGKWICTQNAAGQHVYWDQATSDTDIKNPESWKLAGDGSSCTFMPPINTKNFSVTLIGGGGGGANGVSQQKIYMDATTTSYTPDKDDTYRIAVIGGGGGGHGSDDEDGDSKRGIGGQGGAGAYYLGTLKLRAGNSYSSEIDKGSPGFRDGDKKCKWGSGINGGYSKFKVLTTDLIVAGRGGGGESTKNKGGQQPRCGSGGEGGTLSLSSVYKSSYEVKAYSQGNGAKGKTNTRNNVAGSGNSYSTWGFDNGKKIDEKFYGSEDSTSYGKGGYGNICPRGGGDSTGYSGSTGTVKLWQIIQKRGLGGKASPLTSTNVPVIKGKVKVKIGTGGAAGENGKESIAEIYDNKGKIDRTLKSGIGTAGVLDSPIAENDGKEAEYVNGEPGQNSFWVDMGGGSVGECHGTRDVDIPTTEVTYTPTMDESGEPICRLGYYEVGFVEPFNVGDEEDLKVKCPLSATTSPKGFCVGFTNATAITTGILPLFDKNKYEMSTETLTDTHELYNSSFTYTNMVNMVAADYLFKEWKVPVHPVLNGYYTGLKEEDTFTCYIYEGTKSETTKIDTVTQNAGCEPSQRGTYFGAGGGGGSTSNQVGMSGTGGSGAPGAVIIEW